MTVIQSIEFIQYGPNVLNPVPATSLAINPNNGLAGTTISVTITGTNFTAGTTFSFTPGASITVSSLVIVNTTTATMMLTIGAVSGLFNLITTNIFGLTTLSNAFSVNQLATGDFFDYIFQFPDQGGFLRDPVIQQFAPSVLGSQPGVQLLVYNPVETLFNPVPTIGNALVTLPQLAQSTVPLPGFWAMLSIQSAVPIPSLATHPNIQIVNDRTLMFAQKGSVILTKVDISHINIIINIFGVYVRDGLKLSATGLLLEDGTSALLLEDGTSLLLEGS